MKYELIYHSYADSNITNEQIDSIIKNSRENNSKNGITACLLYHNKQFVQLLEGEQEAIEHLYDNICKDSRHSQVATIHKGAIEKNSFKVPLAFDVVDRDVFEYIGAVGQHELDFLKNDLESAKKLFGYTNKILQDPNYDRMHSKPFGPSA